MVATDGVWVWVERISWVVAPASLLVALIAIVYQLRELRREQRQLAEKPELRIGFYPAPFERPMAQYLIDTDTIAASWPANENMSDPLWIRVYILNIGMRSARDIDVDMRFQPGIQRADADPKDDHITAVEPNGSVRSFSRYQWLSPEFNIFRDAKIRIPRHMAQFKVRLTVAIDGQPKPLNKELTVRVEYRPATEGNPVSAS